MSLSKADMVRQLLHLSNAEIAAQTGFGQSYIRVVRKRTSLAGHPIYAPADVKWKANNPGASRESYMRVRASPVRYARRLACQRALWAASKQERAE